MNNAYIGHDNQLYGIEEHRLVGGKGDGVRLLQVRNGKGLEFTAVAVVEQGMRPQEKYIAYTRALSKLAVWEEL